MVDIFIELNSTKYLIGLFTKKTFISVRDSFIKFHNKLNIILLAFEENGEIGVISNDTNK